MKTKISFHNMPHSDPLEQHTAQKLEKIREYVNDSLKPFNIEVWLKANKQHPHHAVEIHLKTPRFDINAHHEGTDMYVVVDQTIDKIVSQIIKEKEKVRDKHHKVETEKSKFLSGHAAPTEDEDEDLS